MTDTLWHAKNVCVTGGAGMVGAELVALLLEAGANVTVLDDYSRGKNLLGGAYYVEADAGKRETCVEYFTDCDVVFNLAAYVAGVTYNQAHHAEMFERNIRLQTMPVLAAIECHVPHFLQVSSVCVYAEKYQDKCREANGMVGEPNAANSGYAWAKRMGERAIQWSGLPHAVIVRPANIYGIHDYFDERAHVIPALIKKCLDDEVIRVNGTGQEVREFLYAEDAARGMMVALEKGVNGGAYNIGTNGKNACTISELAYMLREMLEADKAIEFAGGQGGDAKRIVNGDKLIKLGWKAETSLSDGLKKVCEWYQSARSA